MKYQEFNNKIQESSIKIKDFFNNNIKKHRHQFNKVAIFSSISVIGLVLAVYTQLFKPQNIQPEYQGMVLPLTTESLPITISHFPIPSESLVVGQTTNLDLAVNTQGESINGVQLFFDVNTSNMDSLTVISASGSGMKVIKSEVTPKTNGFSVKLLILPETIATPISTTQYKKIVRLQFISNSAGTTEIVFNPAESISTISNSEPLVNSLALPPSITFEVLDSLPLPSPSPTPTTITQIVNTLEDAHVKASSPTSNYGSQTTLEIDGRPTYIAYLKFDLSEFLGKNITQTKMRLKVTNSSSSVQNIRSVENNNWSQNNITYNNRPSLGTTIANTINNNYGDVVDIDITEYARQSNGGIMTIGIDSNGKDGLYIVSKEGGANQVKLILTYDTNTTEIPSPSPTSVPSPNPTLSPSPTPMPSPSPVPSPSPTPTPSPITNNSPIFTTSRLSSGKMLNTYSSKVIAIDTDLNDILSMKADNIPTGLFFGNCSDKVNTKKQRTEIKCYLFGVPISKGTFSPTITIEDNNGAQSKQTFSFKIR